MVHESRRARRIRDMVRMKRRAARVFAGMRNASDDEARAQGARNAEHMKSCSCWMCGNPRRYFGERTVQERRQFQVS